MDITEQNFTMGGKDKENYLTVGICAMQRNMFVKEKGRGNTEPEMQ